MKKIKKSILILILIFTIFIVGNFANSYADEYDEIPETIILPPYN